MFETLISLDVPLAGLLAISWWLACARVAALPRRRTTRRAARTARAGRIFVLVAVALTVVRTAVTALLWSIGWPFAADRVIIFGPWLLLPLAAVLAGPFRTLGALARRRRAPDRPVGTGLRQALGSPRTLLPVQAAGVGSTLSALGTMVVVPSPPWGDDLLLFWGGGFVLLLVLRLNAGLSRGAVGAPADRPPRPLTRRVVLGALAGAGVLAAVLHRLVGSRLPADYAMAGTHFSYGPHGREHGPQQGPAEPAARSIAELTGPRDGEPDVDIELVAQQTRVRFPSGAELDAWTFNGTMPGPALTAPVGALVQVRLVNRDVADGVSVHWHGIDVPNAEDGVPGVTQDAVLPGQSHVYRFRAPAPGSYWYHSHQVSAEQVVRGLYGSFVVTGGEPKAGLDLPVLWHQFTPDRPPTTAGDDAPRKRLLVDDGDQPVTRRAAAGDLVRLRLVNADAQTRTLTVTGTPFRVTGTDGQPVQGPRPVTGSALRIGAGGRRDVEFTMPAGGVRVSDGYYPEASLLVATGDGAPTPARPTTKSPDLDLLSYGSPAATPFPATGPYDRDLTFTLDNQLGFYDGRPALLWLMDGQIAPRVPMQQVRQGELVRFTYVNRSHADHPMHLHGHHVLLLSVDGVASTGSPLWLDTVNVAPGQIVQVAFRADNPGIWMDHCHNLEHAAIGMVSHLGYEGWQSPFRAGHATPNRPE